MKNNKFSWKVFISISLFFSFFIIFLTGIVLYLAPAGRVAYWVNWKLIGLSKTDWQALHTVFSYLFAILAIFHLFTMNWKAFWAYLKSKAEKGLNKKREFYIATLATILIFVGILIKIPPFSSVMDLSNYLTDSWENTENDAPVAHAEQLTIPQLMDIVETDSIEQILKRLSNNQIEVKDISLTLLEIATQNSMTPNDVYKIIIYKPTEDMAGTGIGRKTLEQLATENNKNVQDYLDILSSKGFEAKKDQTLKEIAEENNMAAKDIYGLIEE